MTSGALERVKQATQQRQQALEEWEAAILAARAENQTLRAISAAAGVTWSRIHQITKEPK